MARLALTARQAREFADMHPVLRDILLYLAEAWPVSYCEVTSIHRTEQENNEAQASTLIHVVGPPYRACDLRTRTLPSGEAQAVAGLVNERWQYDPQRPSLRCAVVKPHGTGPHMHLQVHPRTENVEP